MKNLKRILSLALAGTMLVGMMMVGASAAGFADADKVEHKEAAETLNALGVMVGSPQADGTMVFNPEGKLDRAAMAKMIAVIMNKGVDPLWADTDKPSFTDVKAGAWYVPYIEYCANLGYVAGYGNGVFGPADELTATQAARMILNAMGYKWDGTGSWELATEVQARDEGINLYNGLDEVVTNKAMTRDNAAQMLYNALSAPIANGKVTEKTTYTLTGTKDGNSVEVPGFDSLTDAYIYAQLNGVTTTAVTPVDGTVTESLGTKYLSMQPTYSGRITAVTEENDGTYTVTVDGKEFKKLTTDYTALLGRKVKVIYKAEDAVYGISTVGTVVATIDGSQYSAKVSTDNKKDYQLADGAAYVVNGTKVDSASIVAGSIVELINENGDAKIELVNVTNKTVAKLTADPELSKDGKKVTVAGIVSDEAIENVIGYADLKEDDVVLYVKINGVTTIEKAEMTTGKVTAVDKNGAYTVNGKKLPVSGLDYATVDDTNFKDEYNFYLDNGGNVVAVAKAGEAPVVEAKKYAVVKAFGYVTTGASTGIGGSAGTTTWQVQLILPDGTTTDALEMVGYENATKKYAPKANADKGIEAFTPDVIDNASTGLKKTGVGKIVSYSIDKDGKYSLKEVGTDIAAGTELPGGATKFDGTNLGNKDTIFLVNVGEGDKQKLSVITGVANLPKATDDNAAKGQFIKLDAAGKAGTFATLVYLEVKAFDSVTAKDTAYFIDNTDYTLTADGYVVSAIVDGELKEDVVINAENYDDVKDVEGLAVVTYDADGKIISATNEDNGATTLNDISMAAEFVKSGDNYYRVANNAVIYKITNKVEAIAVDKLSDALKATKDKDYKAVVVLGTEDPDTDLINTMYITVVDNAGAQVATLENDATKVTLPAAGASVALTKNADKKIVGEKNDTIEGTGDSALYTFGIFNTNDTAKGGIKDTTSTEWYVFTVEVGEGTWKLERFNNGETTAVRTSTATGPETFAMICGNTQNVTYKLTKGTGESAEVYTFNWTK